MTEVPVDAFVRRHTRLQRPPLVPELVLHLADEITPIWSAVEDARGETGTPPPFWAFAWAGGQAVARYLLDHPDLVRGRDVVDLGTGSGLCAVAAARAGAASVLAADVDPLACAAVAVNAAANGVRVRYAGEDLLGRDPPPVDVVVAGDIGYQREFAARALAWLGDAHRGGVTVLVGDPGRAYFPADAMRRLADCRVPTTRELEDADVKAAGVYTFR